MISEVIIEVCEYFDEGLTAKEISEKLHISEKFVQDILDEHFENVMSKPYPGNKKGE